MAHLPTVICARCDREMRCVENGQTIGALIPNTRDPYYRVDGDRYQCETCFSEVWTGFGTVTENFRDDFSDYKPERFFHFREDYPSDREGYFQRIIRSLNDALYHVGLIR